MKEKIKKIKEKIEKYKCFRVLQPRSNLKASILKIWYFQLLPFIKSWTNFFLLIYIHPLNFLVIDFMKQKTGVAKEMQSFSVSQILITFWVFLVMGTKYATCGLFVLFLMDYRLFRVGLKNQFSILCFVPYILGLIYVYPSVILAIFGLSSVKKIV